MLWPSFIKYAVFTEVSAISVLGINFSMMCKCETGSGADNRPDFFAHPQLSSNKLLTPVEKSIPQKLTADTSVNCVLSKNVDTTGLRIADLD